MKIYFYDGFLLDAPRGALNQPYTALDAAYGPTHNMRVLTDLQVDHQNWAVLTNSLVALTHQFGWDEQEKHTDIYLWVEQLKDYIRIDRLTQKEIRYAHNIEHMYIAGTFEYEGELYES